jgi:4-hydroxy-3-polyprenylbenzoate decarboxylase
MENEVKKMSLKDNRKFIEALEKTGDLVRVRQEVDWDLEVGAIIRRANEKRYPAVLFENVKDYPAGYRIFGSPLGTYRRVAVAMGLDPDIPIRELQEEYERRIQHPVKPVVVKDAPCKENIILGDNVDLHHFPAPMSHEGDGGRYLGSWHFVITQHPDDNWTNWGMYRLMLYNKRYTTVSLHVMNHGGRLFYRDYLPKKEPMPIAVAIGADPLSSLVSLAYFRSKQSEVDYAGGLQGEPIELIKCETSDLLVPAHAEIVLEGKVLPAFVPEGPHGEFTGYRHGLDMMPLFQVEAITYRNDPLLTVTCIGIPQGDDDVCQSLAGAVSIKKQLIESGLPVTGVYIPPETAMNLIIVGVKATEPNVAEKIHNRIFAPGLADLKTIVVDDDVDVFNLDQVLHAFASKCHPATGIKVTEHSFMNTLSAYYSREERKSARQEHNAARGVRVLFDCTWPAEWSRKTDVPPRISFDETWSSEIKEKVLANWANYGFK